MKKRVAATILAAALGGGGAAGIALTHAANAADGTTTTVPAGSAPAAGATPKAPGTPGADRTARRTDELTKALQTLVDNGTITAAQRDAVIQALLAAEPAGGPGPGGPGGRGGKGGPGFGLAGGLIGAGVDAAAKALGTDAASLGKELAGGKSIADVAKEKNVSVDTVVAAVVAAETAKIDQAVTDGKLTQAQADTAKASLTQRVTDLVNGKLPAGKGMPGTGGFGGHGGPRGPKAPAGGAGQAPAAPAAPTTAAPAASPNAFDGSGATTA